MQQKLEFLRAKSNEISEKLDRFNIYVDMVERIEQNISYLYVDTSEMDDEEYYTKQCKYRNAFLNEIFAAMVKIAENTIK